MFTIFAGIFSLDFLSTILALNLRRFDGMFYELNPLAAWFQSFGVLGYMGAFIFSMTTLYLLSFGICKLLSKIKNKDYQVNLYIFSIFLFVLFEGNVVWNNIMQMVMA